ncbi:hypothetical protein Pmani_003926 [Petrolisthes manimaculis]|uniref:Uncharacterized protein n=1 Tax=Petrolisthes manimaculis TaxID=1843537 RepID=A0AAE1UNT6_9EUCA|nr:hypothetical protein Pmani_003926 [Petrolisthes manimaculis]
MMDDIMVPSAGANCQEDTDVFLVILRNMGISSLEEELADISIEESNILAYITEYIVLKIRAKVCEDCRKNLQSILDLHNLVHVFLSKKNVGDSQGGELIVSSTGLCEMLTQMETVYRKVIPEM